MKINVLGMSLSVAFVLLATMPLWSNGPKSFAAVASQQVSEQSDSQILANLSREFNTDRFRHIKASVSNGVITLAGTVDLFAYKEAAGDKAMHVKKGIAIRNVIRVGGVPVSDEELQTKLVRKLEYDRVGYGTTTFNAISVEVHNGVVWLGGHAYGPADKSSALSVASYTPGVQDVIDEIVVDPVSPMDDRIRLNVARLIYGYPALMKYSIDPGRPIRISVQNGHVTLYGVVDSKADSDIANIRANGAEGVFSVTNKLQVEGASSERD
jgi:hyperosmotically inducible periplasmic protein